jgi:hypothetical protein
MSHTYDVHADQTNTASSRMQGHPRGRGFSILSRLARGDAPPAATAASQAAPEPAPQPVHDALPQVEPVEQPVPVVAPQEDRVEWTAPVIPFDRPLPTPRHRRDDEVADLDVSVVPVARRSS